MSEIDRLRDELRRATVGDAWHGPSLRQVLAGIEATTAAALPIPEAHSIWEIVLHLTGWAREVTSRLEGGVPRLPADGDWPKAGETGPEAWAVAVEELFVAQEALHRALARFPEHRLDEVAGGERDAPLGIGVTWQVVLHGVAQHLAYHGGQIALLRKQVERGYHRRFAVNAFNRVWELMDKAERSPAETSEMLHGAHASRHHWGAIGEPVHFARGEWQVSRVYCVLRRSEPALVHARLCLEITEAHGLGGFDLAFAYEAMARATALAGDRAASSGWLDRARAAARDIVDEQDRQIVLADLESIPAG